MFSTCSVNPICSRPRTPSVGLPRFQANAAHAGGDFPQRCSMSKKIDLTGQVFGRLKAVSDCGRNPYGLVLWACVCECGKTVEVSSHCLRGGNTNSCGCLKTGNPTHGMSATSEHEAWAGMKTRCYCKTNKRFSLYGGRGITVCERWLNSFDNFYADIGSKPSSKHTLDRKDTNGNYEPSNCRWADWKTQQNNRRNNRIIEFNGEKLTTSQWENRAGITCKVLRQRIDRDGWTFEKALTEPLRVWP